ncbi:MAG: polysaccharide biosynthesis tyrosine autokinase [Deltaproteobacteria bacterium]|nr:polysaccharide biosynthesis tyrosine autokinase [Deltaproteobacteria bacterium]
MNDSQNMPPYEPNALEEVHLQDYLNVIFRRRKFFFLAFLTVFIGVALYTFTMRPVYEASATLHVKDEKGGNSELMDMLAMGSATPVDAELEILKSRTNAEKVVEQLRLNWRIVDRPDNVTFRLLEFISTAEEPSYTVELTGNGGYTVHDKDKKLIGTGQSDQLLRAPGLTLLLANLTGDKGDTFRLQIRPFNSTVAGLRSKIKASEVGKKTNIISVSYSDTNPKQARDVVNTLIRVYLDQSVGFKTEEANRTVGFVEDQLKELRGTLDSAEKNLQAYKSSSGVVQLDATAQQLITKLSDTEQQRTGITLRKKQTEFAVSSLQDAMRRGNIYSPAVTGSDPVMGTMATRLAELEVEKRGLLSQATEKHPAVRAVQSQIDELHQKIRATYQNELNTLARQESDINSELGRYEGVLKTLPEAERDLAKLTRVTKVNADIYTFLLQKHEEARIARASTISNISIVDPAIVPDKPVKPKKSKNLLLGLLVGCMLGVGLAFFQEYLDDTIKDVEGAKRELKWPLLAMIPCINSGDKKEGEGRIDERKTSLIAHTDPKSTISEAFRALRTGLHFSAVSKKKQVLLITSTFPGEGKSTISSNLACILSQTGARTVVIDCDLRRSTLHEKFALTKEPGLTNLLAGDLTIEQVIKQTPIPNLEFISAGVTPPNPAELLGSREMADLVAELRSRYDIVLIDAPPVLAVTDAPLLTAICDLVMVVVEAGRVPVKAARQMRETLLSVSAPVAGMIINDKSGTGREGYGYGKYGYYGYGYYGYGYQSEQPAVTKSAFALDFLRKLFRKKS